MIYRIRACMYMSWTGVSFEFCSLIRSSIFVIPQSRESMRVPLKGNIVLIDEAHNLIEAINAIYTCRISLPQVRTLLQKYSWNTGIFQ